MQLSSVQSRPSTPGNLKSGAGVPKLQRGVSSSAMNILAQRCIVANSGAGLQRMRIFQSIQMITLSASRLGNATENRGLSS